MKKIGASGTAILRGTLALSVSAIIVKIFGVIYKIPLSYILGDEGMGYFNAAYSVYALFYVICTAGVPKAVAVLITEARTNNDTGAEGAIFKIAMRLFLALSLSLTVLFIVFSPQLSHAVGGDKALSSMLVIAPSIIFTSLAGVMRGYLTGKLKLFPIAASQLIEAGSKLAIGLLFANVAVRLNLALPLIAAFSILGITIGSLGSALFLLVFCKKSLSREKPRQRYFDRKELMKKIFKIAVPISLGSSFLSLSGLIDVSLITQRLNTLGYSPEEAVSLYGNFSTLALPMVNLVMSVLTPISVSALPALAEHYIKGDKNSLERGLNNTVTLSTLLCAPCAVAYLLYSFEILDLLFSSQSSVVGAEALSILSVSLYLLCILTVTNTYHEATGRVGVSVKSLIIGCISKGIFGYILIGVPALGVNGAAIATVISYIISLCYSSSKIDRREVRLSKIKACVLPLLLALFAFLIPYVLLYKTGILGYSFISLALIMLISFGSYFSAVLALGYKKALAFH